MMNTNLHCAIDQSEAGPSTPRQPFTEQPQAATDQPESEPHIPFSPLPSSDDKLPFEEVKSKLDMYKELIEKHTCQRKHKGKGKRKARIANSLRTRRNHISDIHDKILRSMICITELSNARGFVYGMVPEIGRPLTGASDSLREWWKAYVMFDKKAPAEIDQFHAENLLLSPVSQRNEPESTFEMLMQLSDPTLGSILSVLMQNCSPKQRQFPLNKGVPPPWWPTGTEDWWDQNRILRENGPPPYKKPHDLNKKWKAAVLLAVIKHMCPDFQTCYDIPHQYKYLMDRMRAKELKYWNMALREEAKSFCSPAEPLERKFPFLVGQPGYNPRPNIGISSGMVSEPRTLFAPSRSHYSAWPTTMPLISQPTPDMQMCGNSSGSLIAPSGFLEPAGVAQQPPSFAFAPNRGMWPTTMPLLDQSQHGVQINDSYIQPQMAIGQGILQQAPVSSEMQGIDHTGNMNYNWDFRASGSGFPDQSHSDPAGGTNGGN